MTSRLTLTSICNLNSMFAAIKARFGGNEATKKTQKALLKQQYENFSASSSESLDSIFNRLQKLVSRLAILVSTATTKVNTASTEICTTSLSDATPRSKTVKIEDAYEKAMYAIDGAGFDWSDMAEDEIQANMALMAFSDSEITDKSKKGLEEFKEPEVNEYGPRDSSLKPTIGCDKESNNSKENIDDSLEQHQKTDDKKKEDDDEPNPKVEKKTVIPYCSQESAHKHMAPRAVLMKTGIKSVNTARLVNTVRSVNTGRPFSTARPFYKITALTKRCFNQRLNSGRPFRSTVNTVCARGFNAVTLTCSFGDPSNPMLRKLVSNKYNYNEQEPDQVNRGSFKHKLENLAIFQISKTLMGGYVTFGGVALEAEFNAKVHKTDNLDFDDVYISKS
ncbi:hypothetical protein Tco_0568016 [Tanacetum coccineum]